MSRCETPTVMLCLCDSRTCYNLYILRGNTPASLAATPTPAFLSPSPCCPQAAAAAVTFASIWDYVTSRPDLSIVVISLKSLGQETLLRNASLDYTVFALTNEWVRVGGGASVGAGVGVRVRARVHVHVRGRRHRFAHRVIAPNLLMRSAFDNFAKVIGLNGTADIYQRPDLLTAVIETQWYHMVPQVRGGGGGRVVVNTSSNETKPTKTSGAQAEALVASGNAYGMGAEASSGVAVHREESGAVGSGRGSGQHRRCCLPSRGCAGGLGRPGIAADRVRGVCVYDTVTPLHVRALACSGHAAVTPTPLLSLHAPGVPCGRPAAQFHLLLPDASGHRAVSQSGAKDGELGCPGLFRDLSCLSHASNGLPSICVRPHHPPPTTHRGKVGNYSRVGIQRGGAADPAFVVSTRCVRTCLRVLLGAWVGCSCSCSCNAHARAECHCTCLGPSASEATHAAIWSQGRPHRPSKQAPLSSQPPLVRPRNVPARLPHPSLPLQHHRQPGGSGHPGGRRLRQRG